MAETVVTELVTNQNPILGLFKARQIQQYQLSKGQCTCGYRFVSSDPTHNIQVTGQQLQDRTIESAVNNDQLYINWLFENEQVIVALYKGIAMARKLKSTNGQFYHRIILTDVTGAINVNLLYATNDLLNL
jgi:hypothetical protein